MKIISSFKDKADPPRRRRKTGARSNLVQFLETSQSIAFLIFIVVAGGLFYLSMIGASPLGVPILPNQVSPVTIHSTLEFSYESRMLTERERERRVQQVIPSFRPDLTYYEEFSTYVRSLLRDLAEMEEDWEEMDEEEQLRAIGNLIERQNRRYSYTLTGTGLQNLLNGTTAEQRRTLFDQALLILRQIHQQGIYTPEDHRIGDEQEIRAYIVFQRSIRAPGQQPQHLTPEAAMRTFDRRLDTGENQTIHRIITNLFRPGFVPNLTFDEERTEELRERERQRTRPIQVEVREGDVLVEAGQMVVPEQQEKLQEYRRRLAEDREKLLYFDEQFLSRGLLVLGILLSAVVYIRIEDRETLKSNSRLFLLGMVAVLNLLVVWLILHLGGTAPFHENPALLSLLPYLAPTALAPLLVAILVGQRPAIFMALLISFFCALMFGNRVESFVAAFLSALVGIYACQQVRYRSRLVRAAFLTGAVVAAFALIHGLLNVEQWHWRASLVPVQQAGASLAVGVLSGMVLVGVLPVVEYLFRRTTDISLLELSDTNHPLLKKMQLDAPGSYHHSLMVANLSENAAQSIGANGLLCRVCSLFHDIGKSVKPEYFTENQQSGVNPHHDRSPSFSALVIKSHVKEGVDLAVQYKMPKVIIDVIKQHHGTSLIQYFFHKAKTQEEREDQPEADKDKVSESTYRYDGPKPQFRESAIILFADSIEAASRSLKKVTPQSIDELIEKIMRDRIDDGQLDECPLTFQEIAKIARSFSYTVLNMLHSRVEYPKEKEKESGKKGEASKEQRNPGNG